jgi:hypothetical protein
VQPVGGGKLQAESAPMEKPNEVDAEPKHTASFWRFILWPAAVLVLYVLSFGPFDHFFGAASPKVELLLRLFYTPLSLAYHHVPPFQRAFDVYMSWWDKHW